MSNTKDIKRRIKSVRNTGKITRAMEMVSAAKMRKSINRVLNIRPYAVSAWNVLTNLTHKNDNLSVSPLLEVREVKSVLVVVITSNRGLCGSFNSQIIKKVKEEITAPKNLKVNRSGWKRIDSKVDDSELNIDFITIGKKGTGLIKKIGKNIIASFVELVYNPSVKDISPLAKIIFDGYTSKKYDKVVIVYTHYVSAILQESKIRQLLPISKIDLKKHILEIDELAKEYNVKEKPLEYVIEPNPEEFLGELVLRLVEMQIYHSILESNASKEASRMIAMKNATESSKEMVGDLTLQYNQIRQRKITQEIAEISAGMTAVN